MRNTAWSNLRAAALVVAAGAACAAQDIQALVAPAQAQCEAFLRGHPDHGEALASRLDIGLMALRAQGAAEVPRNAEAADREMAEVAEALEGLAALPDWWRMRLSGLRQVLDRPAAGASPRVRRVLGRLREAALAEIQRSPHGGGRDAFDLERFWLRCGWTLQGRLTPEVPPAAPTPATAWPPEDYLVAVGLPLLEAGDWEGLLAFVDLLPADPPGPPCTEAQWAAYCNWRALGEFGRVLAFTGLQRCDDGAGALAAMMRWLGPQAEEGDLLNVIRDVDRDARHLEGGAAASLPAAYQAVLARGHGPGVPMPASPFPLRMVLWGDPPWRAAWDAAARAAPLASWGPGELVWGRATRRERALLEDLGLRTPRWAALQGEATLLATGEGPPDPGLLALELRARGPTAQQRLDAFILRNPDQLDARRERFALLRPRMPHAALEPLLAEDAGRAWIPLDFDPGAPWISSRRLWEAQAGALLPAVEDALRRWPGSARLWTLWISWAPFSPRPASPYDLASSLATVQPRSTWLAALPAPVHAAVAADLRRRKRFDLMREWFGTARDGLGKPAGGGDYHEMIWGFLAEAMRGG